MCDWINRGQFLRVRPGRKMSSLSCPIRWNKARERERAHSHVEVTFDHPGGNQQITALVVQQIHGHARVLIHAQQKRVPNVADRAKK